MVGANGVPKLLRRRAPARRSAGAGARSRTGGLRGLIDAHSGGIGFRLLGRVLLFSSAITLVLTAVQLYVDYERGVSGIEQRFDEIERSALGSIGASLWELDERQLTLQLDGLLRLPAITAVEVREAAAPGRQPLVVTAGEPGAGAVIRREFPIRHALGDADRRIGTLQVEATLAGVYRDLVDKALIILVGQGAKTFLVSLFLIVVFHRLVTRHLRAIAAHARGYDLRNAPPPLRLARPHPGRPDELDGLVTAYTAMATGLQDAYREIHETNRRLEADIAARRCAEAALRESEQRFRDYAETTSDWYWATGPDHRFTYVSEEHRSVAADAQSALGRTRWECAGDVDEDPARWREHRTALERHEPFRDFVYRSALGAHRDGYVSVSGKPVFGAAGEFLGYRGAAADVTARVAANARVRDLSLAVERSPAGIVIAEAGGAILYGNPTSQRITGVHASGAGPSLPRMLSAPVWQLLTEAAGRGEVGREEVELCDGPAERGWAAVSVATLHQDAGEIERFLVTLEDITEQKSQARERAAFEARLQQAGKMEAIGRLAGGIAHDFGNLLGAASSFAQFLTEDLAAGSEPHRFADRILQVCHRGKDLVGQLLAFARAGTIERGVLDLVAVVEGCHDLLRASLPSTTRLELEITATLLPVKGNEGQLNQLLLNLCLNANDALDGEPGSIAIRAERVRAGVEAPREADNLFSGDLTPGHDYARLTVRDTGAGIDPTALPRIFEPFFSTKPRGQGTGLGLAVVHGIVTAHGGALGVASAPGVGTTFVIYLPLEAAVPQAAPAGAPHRVIGGRERILVVDDERDVGDALTIGLTRLGYEVACAHDPRAALERFGATPDAWDIVISDHVMPGLTGLGLIASMKALRPDLLAVLYTASNDLRYQPGDVGSPDGVLRKPLAPADIAAQLRGLVEAREGGIPGGGAP